MVTTEENIRPSLLDQSSFVSLLDTIMGEPNVSSGFRSALDQVKALITREPEPGQPFLTVLLRTQGHRIEPLKDALLCLAAQTDEDFEVILIDHDADADGAAAARAAVAEQPELFRERIRVLEVKGGTRSSPLNAGVRAANGRFIAVYDDDDILFGNWVEAFHDAARRSEGRMLRALAATQRVAPERWPNDHAGFRTTSWPNAEYAASFDLIDHLRVNHSPFMTWAFPRVLFTEFGVEFDEELPVCEDWDMILRGATICGVEDVTQLTAIYRRWEGGHSSYTAHSNDIWRSSEQRVIDRLDDAALLLPRGSVTRIRKLLEMAIEGENARHHLIHLTHSRAWRWAAPVRAMVIVGARAKRVIRRLAAPIPRRRRP